MDCSWAMLCSLPGSFLDVPNNQTGRLDFRKKYVEGLGFVQEFVVRARV